jgi:hypothetical protein
MRRRKQWKRITSHGELTREKKEPARTENRASSGSTDAGNR